MARRRHVGARRAAPRGRRRWARRRRRARRLRCAEPPAEPAGGRRRPAPARARRGRPRASSAPSAAGRSCTGRRWPTAGRRSSRSTPRTAATPTCCTAATATILLRDAGDEWPVASLERDVEHEGLLLLLARRGGVRCPDAAGRHRAARRVDGRRHGGRRRTPARRAGADELDAELLDAVWREVAALHARRPRPPCPAGGQRPRHRRRSGDHRPRRRPRRRRTPDCRRSTGPSCSSRSPSMVGAEAAVAAAARVLAADDLAAAIAVPAAAGALGGDPQAGLEVDCCATCATRSPRRRSRSPSRSSGWSACARAPSS